MVSAKIEVESFTSIPTRTRGGAAGGAKPSELLTKLRELVPNTAIKIAVADKAVIDKEAKSLASQMRRVGALPYSPVIRTFKEEGVIRIYRVPGKDWAVGPDGTNFTDAEGRRMTQEAYEASLAQTAATATKSA